MNKMDKKWPVSMKDENDKPILFEEGWHTFTIADVKLISEEESGSGNAYFFWTMEAEEGTIEMRTTLIKGKRWLLKQTLSACGIEAKEDDPEKKYAFGPEDVLGKSVLGKVENRTGKPFQGRDGNMVTPNPKSEICSVKKIEGTGAQAPAESSLKDQEEIPF